MRDCASGLTAGSDLPRGGQITPSCQAPLIKIFLFFRNENQCYMTAIPSHPEGRRPSSPTLGRDAVDAKYRKTSDADADGEVVWSWRPGAGAKCAAKEPQTTGARKPIPGESSYKP
jgi:hypothetical protein